MYAPIKTTASHIGIALENATTIVNSVATTSIGNSSFSRPRMSNPLRRFSQKMMITADQPTPMSRRFAPVTFAAASDISFVTSPSATANCL